MIMIGSVESGCRPAHRACWPLGGHHAQAPAFRFQLEEATIADVHRGIQTGQIIVPGARAGVHRLALGHTTARAISW